MADDARIKNLYYAARKIDASDEREAFLDASCAGDDSLRWDVSELLDAQGEVTGQALAEPFTLSDAGELHATEASSALNGRIGPYELISVLGEGGMGTVYRARQTAPVKRDVALKVVKHGMASATVVARFEAERQALALMDHSNIAKVFDAGTTAQGLPYFVMELVNGLPLTNYCQEQNLPARERLKLFVDVCRAIQHAHQKGIIHRDIKPSNILVASADGKAVPKVIDFGVAKAFGQKLTEETMNTQTGMIMGTLDYMSPEQAGTGEMAVDARTDVYALGAVMYELLTGVTPLGSGGKRPAVLYEALRIIREVDPERPSTRMSFSGAETQVVSERDVRGELDWIALKALDKNPARRYQSADGFADDIERHLNGEAVSAGPDSGTYRLKKFIGRNRAMSMAAGAVAAALVLGLCAAMWQADRAMKAEKNYKEQRDTAVILREQAVDARAVSERTLAELKRTAPVFFSQAKIMLEDGAIDNALEKIGYAVQLDDANADYHLFRANLQQSTQDLATAAESYRRVLALRPTDESAKLNLVICERLLKESGGVALELDQQRQLYAALRAQKRTVESAQLGALVDPDEFTARGAIVRRLREYRKQPRWKNDRVSALPDGTFKVTLNTLAIGDLSVLRGQPVSELNLGSSNVTDLSGLAGLPLKDLNLLSTKVSDLSPLHGMPLERLNIGQTRVTDLSPLRGMKLRNLTMGRTGVSDLSPLAGMPLTDLQCFDATSITDLAPLKGAPLVSFHIRSASRVSSLAPLAGAPLKLLHIVNTPVKDLGPLARCLQLEELTLFEVPVSDLSPLTDLPITRLDCDVLGNLTDLGPLRGMPLRFLRISRTSVTDLSPLADCLALEELVLPVGALDLTPLRKLPKLHLISVRSANKGIFASQTAEEFWKEYDAKEKK